MLLLLRITVFSIIQYPLLYHYSTIESLFSGILVKERESDDKAISLFATDHRYLNDEKEIKHGCDVLSDITSGAINFTKPHLLS